MLDVSFIIPYFNGQSTIVRCLDSIYSLELYKDSFEIIIVDDCSLIPAQTVLAEYICTHPDIHIIRHTENKCQGGAKNTGIRYSKGRYIIFADQDDFIIPNNLKLAMLEAFNSNPDMLSCRFNVISIDGESTEKGLKLPNSFTVDGKTFCESCFDAGQSLAPWSYLYRRDYLQQISHPMAEGVLMEDSDWIAWHLIFANKIVYLPIPIYCWVMCPSSITHGQSWRHKADWVKFGYRKIRDSRLYASHSERFASIMESDGRFNIEQAFKKLWKTDKYYRFYKHIGDEMLGALRQMQWSSITAFMINYPKLTAFCLSIVGPILKGFRHIIHHSA